MRSQTADSWVAAVLLASVVLAGCGESLPPETTADQAVQVLRSALDGWRQGGSPAEVTVPAIGPVQVLDRDWESGLRLEDYRLEGEAQPLGLGLQYAVRLVLRDPQGRPMEKTVTYVVQGAPSPVVARQDLDF
ncbi:MAG: hypothetical protein KatS3mg108_0218 [Isosphaeraceae bacterium]|jgi:hypothetical protein|nr:MAG: hypothetical protein KatS3mg108_0218 [Isosphaeraceae bacterium]